MTPVAIALGSNLGDRAAHLHFAVDCLRRDLDGINVSQWYDTAPVGVDGNQPRYLNGAITGTTQLSAKSLLATLLAIEYQRGRTRPHPGAARTLDLDLILFGSEMIVRPDLRVPHPRFRERRFVLEPLAQIAPDWIDPETRRTIAQLLAAL